MDQVFFFNFPNFLLKFEHVEKRDREMKFTVTCKIEMYVIEPIWIGTEFTFSILTLKTYASSFVERLLNS